MDNIKNVREYPLKGRSQSKASSATLTLGLLQQQAQATSRFDKGERVYG